MLCVSKISIFTLRIVQCILLGYFVQILAKSGLGPLFHKDKSLISVMSTFYHVHCGGAVHVRNALLGLLSCYVIQPMPGVSSADQQNCASEIFTWTTSVHNKDTPLVIHVVSDQKKWTNILSHENTVHLPTYRLMSADSSNIAEENSFIYTLTVR